MMPGNVGIGSCLSYSPDGGRCLHNSSRNGQTAAQIVPHMAQLSDKQLFVRSSLTSSLSIYMTNLADAIHKAHQDTRH
eukprot:scaffold447104_cov34-Prasinocladus_malaysianus.AAC.1